MNSPLEKSIQLFKDNNPHKLFIYNTMVQKYPNDNPLAIIDTVNYVATMSLLSDCRVCSHCGTKSDRLITTLIDELPAKYCSLDCLQYSV